MTEEEKITEEQKAYVMLEVDQAEVVKVPRVSHLFRHISGGQDRVWEALEASDVVEARKLVEFSRRLTLRQREAVPFEAIAIAAGMTPRHAFGVVSEVMVEYSQDAAKLILHAAAPEMMTKAVQRASAMDGTADGKILLQALNLVPRARNTFTVVNGDVVKGNKNQVAVLPSTEDVGRRLGSRFNVEMSIPVALPAPPDDDDDADDDQMYSEPE